MQIIDFFTKFLKVSIYRIEAQSKYGEELIIYHIGKDMMPDYFFNKFYAQPPQINVEARIYFWQLKKEIKFVEQKAHLLFIKTHKFLKFLFGDNFIIIPEYIRQTLDVNREMKDIRKGFHKNLLKTEIRKIRKYRYTYEFSKKTSELNFFYNKMFLPFVRKRHKDYAHVDSLNEARRFASEGILFIKKSDEFIAGATLQKMRNVVVTRMFGVTNGDEALFKQAAIAAIFYFLIKFAKEKKYKKIDFGYAYPILSDGILLYKNKWGTKIEYVPLGKSIFVLKICKLNGSLKKILKENPLIIINNNKLSACIFSNGDLAVNKIIGTNITIAPDYFKGLELTKYYFR